MPKFFDPAKFRRVADIIHSPLTKDKEDVAIEKAVLFKKRGRPGVGGDLVSAQPRGASSFPSQKKKLSRVIVWAAAGFCLLAVVLITINLYNFRKNVSRSLEKNLSEFNSQVSDSGFLNLPLDPQKIKVENLNLNLKNPLERLGTELWPLLKNSVGAYQDFQALIGLSVSLLEKSELLLRQLPNLVLEKKGGELISSLKNIRDILNSVVDKNTQLATAAARLKDFSPTNLDFYLPLQVDLGRFKRFADALIAWLELPSPRRVFVMFLNPSEIRPGGGFLGSYADLNLKGGRLENIDIHDVSDIDQVLTKKAIPPKPLQAATVRWKTADANWFFDFPASAEKVLGFAEDSSLYRENQTVFDGALALTARVVEDLLGLIGPVEVGQEGLVLTEKNFLTEIQKQIQSGREKNVSYPKKILQDLTPVLLSKIASLDDVSRERLFSLVTVWLARKDLMIYFRDPEFQKFFSHFNLMGQVYELPQGFIGDYLAVVNANLGGGKTDIFIDQKITLVSQINDDATVSNHLVIERTHRGNESKDWWYKTTNQNYLQVFTPKDPQLDNFSGGIKKTIKPPINYKAGNYITDPLVNQIESTRKDFLNYPVVENFEEFGKGVLATWTKTEVGKKSEIVFDYTRRLPVPLAEGKTYQFIFEKQAGASGVYKFEISAPVGFVWEENSLPIFEYQSSDPPGRLIINLTLKRG